MVVQTRKMRTGPLFNKLETCTKKFIVCQGGGDAGKCLGIDTPVLMYDLSVKAVQDVVPGDKLMGIDGTPRNVLSTVKNKGQLYNVKQARGIDYVCNDAHILCLKHSGGKEIYKTVKGKKIYQGRVKKEGIQKITAEDYYNSSKKTQLQYTGFKTGFDLPTRKVTIDPYYLGLWLGDGSSRNCNITTVDKEVREYLFSFAPKHNCRAMISPSDKNTIRISRPLRSPYKNGKQNTLSENLNAYNLFKNKHIPFDYLHNSIEVRKKLLAGLIDSDGTLAKQGYYAITSTKKPLADQILNLARSIGYSARITHKIAKMKRADKSVYECDAWTICISCNNGESIPVLIERKKKIFSGKVSDCLNSSIKLEKLEVGDYYGFCLDGDRMFMLGDYTVTHNTVTILQFLAQRAVREPGAIITVTAIDLPNLKRGAIRQFKKYVAVDDQVAPHILAYNKSEQTYHFKNGSLIEFKSFSDEDDARGSERDYLFVNEANNVNYNLFWQLKRKTRKRVIIDYNPTSRFWAHHKLLSKEAKKSREYGGKVQQYIIDHRHNPFLTKTEHEDYENLDDAEQFRVYARGLTGAVSGQIYKWRKIDKVPQRVYLDAAGKEQLGNMPFGFGMDLGYTSDVTAIVKIYYDKKKRYYELLLYMTEDAVLDLIAATPELNKYSSAQYYAKILKDNGCTVNSLLWGDHDKNMSTRLRREGIPYRMAKKGPNSVTAGISAVKRNTCYTVGKQSDPIQKETEVYVWEEVVDILTGNKVTTNQPVDGVPEHSLDAIRYFEQSFSLRNVEE